MKLHKEILIEKACSGDSARTILNSVYLEKPESGSARLVATNGRIAAIVPVSVDAEDSAGYITAVALKAARKAAPRSEECFFSANGVLKMPDGQTFERPNPGKYPNVENVIPKDETKFSVSLDPALLLAVSEAIGAGRGVTLEISGEGKAVRVRPMVNPRAETPKGGSAHYVPACPEALGLIMPIAKPV